MSKWLKILISITLFIICIGGVLYYSEYRTKNFVNAVDSDLDNFKYFVDSISILEMENDGFNTKLVAANKDEKLYSKLYSTLINWEVKRTLTKDFDTKNSYQIVITRGTHSINTLNVLISKDGIMNFNGKNYQLKKENIEELLEIIK
ncbi:hypothetical protein M3649_02105 [Ureibacillus chungkukjangi]|uniref:hypothetical protein n=1 Tax=Ureibacillus chungkukjangi TaxID=1202712 RepID=UPI00203E0750|nr:hypothetical protein [Ureibacillus chungkukjangi]MCM3386921.1 hypothetical protein [Ureibacillus chungkukjangi]